MISPLLHLLQRGDRAARSHAVTHLAALPPGPSYAAPPVPRGMLFLSGGDTGDMALARIVQRYPRLSTLHTTSNVPDGQAGHPRLLVIGAGVADAGPAILEAMATGMLVVSPDDGAACRSRPWLPRRERSSSRMASPDFITAPATLTVWPSPC